MHTAQTIQTLAHRAPPATRTRARWQPYNSTPSTSRNIILHTPLSVSPSHVPTTPCNNTPSRPTPSIAISQTPKDSNSKEPPKQKGSLSIADQAVKALCEIWRPQDIPDAFLPPRGPSNLESRSVLDHTKHAFARSTSQQLSQLPLCADSTNTASTSHDQSRNRTTDPASNLATMKCFVHEVLRRSRTSGCVLRAAICYLEAIRVKVPQLLQEERAGIRPDTSIPRIITLDELHDEMDLQSETSVDMVDGMPTVDDSIVKTVRIVEQSADAIAPAEPTLASAQINADINAALPCPLLCPRRAFLASLILASKFTQDKCYSNRAWAKLSGLPPKEIGRCERALGEALDWRLWVGKQSLPGVSGGQRTLGRSQSESCLKMPPTPVPAPVDIVLNKSTTQTSQSGLRRCATLPAEAYALQIPRPLAEALSIQKHDVVDYSQDHDISGSDVPIKVEDMAYASDHSSNNSSPSTPGLAYSPSSSESSVGDQTVQMSTYFDEPLQTPAGKGLSWSEPAARMVLLGNNGLQDSCAKSAMEFHLAPGLVSDNMNIEAGWYADHTSLSSFTLPALHTVECS